MNACKKHLTAYFLFGFLLFLISLVQLKAQPLDPKFYNIGSPTLTNIWVDPINGKDDNNGASRTSALKTIPAAWNMLPRTPFTTGYKINLMSGNYAYRDLATNSIVGLYLDERHGTFQFPIIIESADAPSKARIWSAFDFRDVSYLYLIGLDFQTDPSSDGGGNSIHFADGNHIFIKNCIINGYDGTTRKPQETLKVNQVKYIYVEDCDISGAFWFALDYVGVQYGHIQGCKIHDASEDCLLLKGGTAQIRVEGNHIYNADRFGFSAGQGAGFDFMVFPWLHYEAYDLKFINNIIYQTNYAGIAVLGGYNILIAFNTLYKVGIDKSGDRTLLTVALGQRGCDGAENDTCNVHHQFGGWSPGPWSTPPLPYGQEADCIPNKNVFIYNNIFYNPGSDSTVAPHFEIRAPYNASDYSSTFLQSSNLPNPVLSDDNLQIKGNLIWNGSKGKLLINEEDSGAQDSNPSCNRTQLIRDNIINTIEPLFVNPPALNFHPAGNSNIFSSPLYNIPGFLTNDKPAKPIIPTGNLVNIINRDYDNKTRSSSNTPGAFASSNSTGIENENSVINPNYHLSQNYPNPFNPSTVIKYQISQAGLVSLKIYDLIGKEVASLVNEFKQPGNYSSLFEPGSAGRTLRSPLSSGIYFYTLTSGNFSQTKKMIIMK